MKAPQGTVADRLAGAPISWGVCEVPGWGAMLPADRVLSEMASLGLKASELGALGYLGDEPAAIRALLERHGLGAVGGFVPLVIHDRALREALRRDAERAASLLAGSGGTYFVTAAVLDQDWSEPGELSTQEWDAAAEGLEIVEEICAGHGLTQVLHPHVGTIVELASHFEEVLERSPVAWCLDTGHLAIGGADPVAFAMTHADRVGLVHVKDVALEHAEAVRSHKTSLLDATKAGMFRSLGRGDVDVAGVVRVLEQRGYQGWYVLEQDTTIDPSEAERVDPKADVQVSVDYLLAASGGSSR
ncbi:MAG: sugar phosphate isomerase/epimerase [Actinomycetota bacterium]|nr:sugar phosphate isomerase/epimerase [Actinomycetota bacterium]